MDFIFYRSVAAWKLEVRETLNRTMNKYMEQKHARDSRFRSVLLRVFLFSKHNIVGYRL
jgi:hypothetical protein